MLEIADLHVSYGAIEAVQGINLTVPEGKIVALIGTNGAGKSTTLRTIWASSDRNRGAFSCAART